jgi:hypothetical protein
VSIDEQYIQLALPEDKPIEDCPCCGSTPTLWQYQSADGEATSKSVMCSNGTAFGPQDGIADEGCPLYMPSQGFYRATIREAINYWNEYAKALMKQQRANRWAKHSVLRTATTQEPSHDDN